MFRRLSGRLKICGWDPGRSGGECGPTQARLVPPSNLTGAFILGGKRPKNRVTRKYLPHGAFALNRSGSIHPVRLAGRPMLSGRGKSARCRTPEAFIVHLFGATQW
jgi:hypothetical protein